MAWFLSRFHYVGKKTNYQIIVFIDPKGLEHSKGLDDEKIQFANIEIKKKDRAKNSSK